MSLKIPMNLSIKSAAFPESSPGVIRVTLVLLDGRKIREVSLTRKGELIKIGDKPVSSIWDMDFNVFEIKDVIREA